MKKALLNNKIAFCITCMNRLLHIQKTLIKNIEDNFLINNVEFVLLDYNSTDGLEEWVKSLEKYISLGILKYYKTTVPQYYQRAHSRNMAFKLADADIVCNLDADNFLGEGFAEYILSLFEEYKDEKIFITSSCLKRDTYGRICVYKKDFLNVRGYNESLSGYGVEDVELYNRFIKAGFVQISFHNPLFEKALHHPHEDRISQEFRFRHLKDIYISHATPSLTNFLVLYDDFTYDYGALVNNFFRYLNNFDESFLFVDSFIDLRGRIILGNNYKNGKWEVSEQTISLILNSNHYNFSTHQSEIKIGNNCFQKINDADVKAEFILYLSDAINLNTLLENLKIGVNNNGFGKGFVFKNFEYSKEIILN